MKIIDDDEGIEIFYDDMTTSMFGVQFEHFRPHLAWQKEDTFVEERHDMTLLSLIMGYNGFLFA